ncbi:MAG: chorismate-binding protein [Ignavibacteriaceae bacterium]
MNINKILQTVKTQPFSALYYEPPVYKSAKTEFFSQPDQILEIRNKKESDKIFREIDKLSKTKIILTLINYEFGHLVEDKLKTLIDAKTTAPYITFFVYSPENVITINSSQVDFSDIPQILKKEGKPVNNFRLNTRKQEYISAIKKIRRYIECGDTYQTNYTVKGNFNLSSGIETLFLKLIFNQSSRYNWLINTGSQYIASISPELFFIREGKSFFTKPMKGTIKRGNNFQEDLLRQELLSGSSKELSENVMIVDLLRNDLGRISETGSVKVRKLFEIEKYETVFQMTSTISGKLKQPGIKNILSNIFPCGSVTGAPKIRTMEIIRSLEKEDRGIYTGSIGTIRNSKSSFNVAIRTLVIDQENNKGEIGLGCGITWGSDPESEFKEVRLKGKFLTGKNPYFEIFETILVENKSPFLLDYHLKRLKNAADFFIFSFSIKSVENRIRQFIKSHDQLTYKLKVTLNKWGGITLVPSEINPLSAEIKVILSPSRIKTTNRFQYFKTTERRLYDSELKKYSRDGYSEVIYLNEKDEVAEGSFTNIVIRKGKNLFTPPIEAGILNGVYRQYLIDSKKISVSNLSFSDLKEAKEIYLINSVRKEITLTPELLDY